MVGTSSVRCAPRVLRIAITKSHHQSVFIPLFSPPAWISVDSVFVWGGWTAIHLLTSIDMDTFAITEGMVPESSNQDGQDADKAGTGQLPEGANKFQRAIAAWRGNSFEPQRYSLSGLFGQLIDIPGCD